ncbi:MULTISPECIES: TetR/AcrR family transcriptional regulator [unclassified Streptomyces]|uniref:TetR/AcrR family transcriptional regulator n=1 Tax=unclassified Streptomyces TaxID=2593676 RepID=UPI0036E767F4
MTQPVRRTMRSDAEENRARIIAFARETFARTPEATLKSIARGAGVGQGTMYRHFRTREDLLLNVYGGDIEELAAAAAPLLTRNKPRTALRLWLERLAAYGSLGNAASQAVQAATRADLGGPHHIVLRDVLDTLLIACRAAGQVRAGVTAREVLLLMSYVWNTGDKNGGREPGGTVLDIVMDGLATVTTAAPGSTPGSACVRHPGRDTSPA